MRIIGISIHALRVEGDEQDRNISNVATDFYPRPPGGGRPLVVYNRVRTESISIHALRVEGDAISRSPSYPLFISIHALRVEGDLHRL